MSSPNEPPSSPTGALLRPEEAARLLRVSLRYLRQLSCEGLIASVRVGQRATRYLLDDVTQFIARRRRGTVSIPDGLPSAAVAAGRSAVALLEDAPPPTEDEGDGMQPQEAGDGSLGDS